MSSWLPMKPLSFMPDQELLEERLLLSVETPVSADIAAECAVQIQTVMHRETQNNAHFSVTTAEREGGNVLVIDLAGVPSSFSIGIEGLGQFPVDDGHLEVYPPKGMDSVTLSITSPQGGTFAFLQLQLDEQGNIVRQTKIGSFADSVSKLKDAFCGQGEAPVKTARNFVFAGMDKQGMAALNPTYAKTRTVNPQAASIVFGAEDLDDLFQPERPNTFAVHQPSPLEKVPGAKQEKEIQPPLEEKKNPVPRSETTEEKQEHKNAQFQPHATQDIAPIITKKGPPQKVEEGFPWSHVAVGVGAGAAGLGAGYALGKNSRRHVDTADRSGTKDSFARKAGRLWRRIWRR